MKTTKLKNVFVSRTLVATDLKKRGTEITVKIGKPTKEENYYACPYQIFGLAAEVKNSYGEDAVQALELALKKIGAELDYYQRARNLKITWLGMHHSFPELKMSEVLKKRNTKELL